MRSSHRVSRSGRLTLAFLSILIPVSGAFVPVAGFADARGGQSKVGLAVSPARLEIGLVAGSGPVQTTFDVTNTSSGSSLVKVELVDLIVNSTGAFQPLPLRSTPYSLAHGATLNQAALALPAAGVPDSTGHVTLTIVVAEATHAEYGGVLFTPISGAADGPNRGQFGLHVVPRILVPLIAAPLGRQRNPSRLAPGNELAGSPGSLDLVKDSRSWVDHVIPFDLPHVADHRPLRATSHVKNSGNTFAEARSHYEFSTLIGNHVFLREDPSQQPTFPGTVATDSVSTVIDHQGNQIETAPLVDLVKVEVTTKMVLLAAASAPVRQQQWIVVFPWKEVLLVLVAAFLGGLLRRQFSRAQSAPKRAPARPWGPTSIPAIPITGQPSSYEVTMTSQDGGP